jgi:mRNA interferase MazF
VAAINRGDIFDAEIAGLGSHPVLVVSRQEAIYHRTRVTVAVVTSTIRDHAAEVPLDETHGLDHASVADCDELYTIEKGALTRRRGKLELGDLMRLDEGLRVSPSGSRERRNLSNEQMRIQGHYDEKADIAWLRFEGYDPGRVVAEEVDFGLRELDADGDRVVGLEYWQASEILPAELLEMLPAPPLGVAG